MNIEPQPLETLDKSKLVAKVGELKASKHRLVQICATTLTDSIEITYSFEKDQRFVSLRLAVPRKDAVIPSITGVYFGAFTYENELQDLFGLKVPDLALNFNGNFYMKAKNEPFNETKAEADAKTAANKPAAPGN
jgi:ech hydrogenase subunit D